MREGYSGSPLAVRTLINVGGAGGIAGKVGGCKGLPEGLEVSVDLPSSLGWALSASAALPRGPSGSAARPWSQPRLASLAPPAWLLSPAGMRILVTLLLDTLPMLGNVLLLCFFVFFIFGIVGVQLWAGLLRNRCFLPENFSL